jgi:alpha-beta hydrolase superfamily lysophospholipase
MMSIAKKLFAMMAMFAFVCGSSVEAAKKAIEVECEVKDGSIIVADVYYPEVKKTKYSTIVLLHSLGYNSSRWAEYAKSLADAGYGVVAIDFRGHGRSVYTAKLNRQSWSNYKREVFQKYPEDILALLRLVKEEFPNLSFEEWGIVGADIGANTAVLVAEKAKNKPKTLVLISPHESHKGLFIPIAIVNMGAVPVLSISCEGDRTTIAAQNVLKKYAQSDFVIQNFKNNMSGVHMVNNPEIGNYVSGWLESKVAHFE